MTNTLLIIIIVLLAARFILQLWQGHRAFNHYATTRNVKRQVAIFDTLEDMSKAICDMQWWCDYEVVSVLQKNGKFIVVFQSKEIKNYLEK